MSLPTPRSSPAHPRSPSHLMMFGHIVEFYVFAMIARLLAGDAHEGEVEIGVIRASGGILRRPLTTLGDEILAIVSVRANQ